MIDRTVCVDRPKFKLSLLSIGHFFNDLYAAFLPTFVPTLISRLGITMAQAGLLNSVVGIIHIFLQPLLGYVSDRTARSYLVMIGPILTCLGATFLPSSPTYGMALFLVGLWGVGSATFHPQGHGGVGHVVPQEKLTVSLAIFSVAGNIGVTISPLFAVALAKIVGVEKIPYIAIVPVLILAIAIYRYMPVLSEEAAEFPKNQGGLFHSLFSVLGVIYPVWMVSMARDATSQGIRFFLPIRIVSEGGNISMVGTILFLIMLCSTIAMLISGKLSDRWGKVRVLIFVLIAGPICMIPAAYIGGKTSIILYILGTSLLNSSMPITAAVAQEQVPHSRGMASSIVMGLSWGVANLLTGPLGKLGDVFGITSTMLVVAALPLLALPMVFMKSFRSAE
ncbi:MAG: MFS transporter [Aminobacterium sp.]|jgi:FSR family fosmidomycin resistance protein-like MFS transporter|nr:MFS transporter [Aminobacterium sp.]MDD2207218.1 MFS transporter [Aminobacterium sp.]MDD3425951.1 MFS transporter [Aminobacterium sp.]MDD3707210.1 MFS transporter [Aminobacterium sp.]MDD4229060.1 MFS transporter [Aminobacterium sp.]MDD4551948.1 MFS transporter [Aminobacterium sp.]